MGDSEESFAALFEESLKHDVSKEGEIVRGTVIREKHATFSLAAGQPVRPPTRTGVDGLLVAGDWIDTGLPGTIESAVVSGHMAARAILNANG